MKKPTLFFSHSSKDRDMILTIKNKLMSATGGVLDIFMSSDGQSIPFGTNWIHKIEEGLNDARIMFVFVTENSLPSGWIYFEAGFAYNKGIKVIPVGIGVDIGALKAPLNLLQGFNITSGDSLNNFISVVNKTFDYSFSEQFTPEDYQLVLEQTDSMEEKKFVFEQVVRSLRFKLRATEYHPNKGTTLLDVKACFDKVKEYLENSGIPFSYAKNYLNDEHECIMVKGVKIVYEKSIVTKVGRNGETLDYSSLTFGISPIMFEESFELCQSLFGLFEEEIRFYVHVRLKEDYKYCTRQEDCAALLMAEPDWFTCIKDQVERYTCSRLNLSFGILNTSETNTREYVLGIGYDPENFEAANITKLVAKLCELKVIHNRMEE